MALRLQDKKALVAEIHAVAAEAHSAVVAEYRGLTAEKLSALRAQARQNGTVIKVVKNSLAKRAVVGTAFECMNDVFIGPVILGFSMEDPGAAARVMKDFSKGNEALKVTAVSVGGLLLPGSDIERLAKLPTRDQALAILMGVLQAPVTKFVRTLQEPVAQTARVVAAVRDLKQAA
jgi:large subunit ribosomal protein L10